MKFNLKNTEGGVIPIEVPDDLSQVPLSVKLAFDDMIAQYASTDADDAAGLILLVNAISEISGVSKDDLLKTELIACIKDDRTDIASLEDSLLRVYNFIKEHTMQYKFGLRGVDDHTFEYKDKIWHVPHVRSTMFTGRDSFSHISLAQGIESLKIRKYLKETEVDADDKFTNYIRAFSVLVEDSDKPLPDDEYEFNLEVEKRMEYFQEIDSKNFYDVYFFLTTYMIN